MFLTESVNETIYQLKIYRVFTSLQKYLKYRDRYKMKQPLLSFLTITMPHRDKKVQEGGKVVPYDCGILYTYSSYGEKLGMAGANTNDSKTTWSSSLLILAPQEQERDRWKIAVKEKRMLVVDAADFLQDKICWADTM
jgi:hypothetical protein